MSGSTASARKQTPLKYPRCKKGSRRNKKTHECVKTNPSLSYTPEWMPPKRRPPKMRINTPDGEAEWQDVPHVPKKKRCKRGTRKDRKTGVCQPYPPKPRVSARNSARISPTRIQSLFRGYTTRKTTNNLLKEHKELNVILNSLLKILQQIQDEADEDTGDAYIKNTDRVVDADKLNIRELGTFISAESDNYTQDDDYDDGDEMTAYRFDFSNYELKIEVKDDTTTFKDELDDILENLQKFTKRDNRRGIKRR